MIWMILVCLLTSPDYRLRERVNGVLARHIDFAALAIASGEYSNDPEVARRSTLLMNAWWRRHGIDMVDQYKPFNGWPWIDAHEHLHGSISHHYVEKARWLYPELKGLPEFPVYRYATRLMIADKLADRIPVENLLNQLWDSHEQYCWREGIPLVMKR